ncbi:MAG TPA: DinB family protein [Pyrinomonadaceae bacterium]|nr:DinB family protein [Pyrinomonadaceae bacterium]
MQDFLDDFRETISRAAERFKLLSEQQSQKPRAEGKWSPREILGHLIDSAANNHSRFVRAQLKDDLVFDGYAQTEWVKLQRYQEEPWADLVQLWQSYNRHILHVIDVTPEEQRTRLRTRHNLHKIASDLLKEDEPVTLDWFMRDYLDHMKKHLAQIEESVRLSESASPAAAG